MNNVLNDDSQAMILICSNLAISTSDKENIKPYTLTEWNKLANKLLNSQLKSPRAFFHHASQEWKEALNLTEIEVERLKRLLDNGAQLGFQLDNLSNSGIWVTTRAENTYPTLLKSRLKQKCPIILYYAGNPSLFKTKGVGIVGSRNAEQGAINFTKILSEKCTYEGYTIVSGGAKGVDSIAQSAALNIGGTVISIVSDSLGSKIKNKEYREAISNNQLLMISPFHPNSKFKAYNAMDRNKYIYTLSKFAVAVSSDYNRGGTWAGATENLKNNWVPLFVRKEEDIPEGNFELLKIGAIPLLREEILNNNEPIDNWLGKASKNYKGSKKEQITIEDLIKVSNIDANEIKEEKVDINNDKIENQEEILKSNRLENVAANVTAYEILKPYILENLSTEKNIDELTSIFDVKKIQMQEWVNKLLLEDKVVKLNNPVRYRKS